MHGDFKCHIRTFFPQPTIIISESKPTVCAGESVTLSAFGALSYSWNTGATSAAITVTPGSTTAYTLVGTNPAGCSTSTVYSLLVDQCTGQKTNVLSGFKIYPNPGNGIYILETGNEDCKSLMVSDFTGKSIFVMQTTTEKIEIDLEKSSTGIYYATLSSLEETVSIKLVKE